MTSQSRSGGKDHLTEDVMKRVKHMVLTPDNFSASDEAHHEMAKLAKCATLYKLLMISSNFQLKPKFILAETNNFKDMKFSLDGKPSFIEADIEKEQITGVYTWKITVQENEESEDSAVKEALSASCDYLIFYDNAKSESQEGMEYFFRKVARMASYPYFRSMVSQYAWASEANLPILPIIRF